MCHAFDIGFLGTRRKSRDVLYDQGVVTEKKVHLGIPERFRMSKRPFCSRGFQPRSGG
jgi:hypothetical protein